MFLDTNIFLIPSFSTGQQQGGMRALTTGLFGNSKLELVLNLILIDRSEGLFIETIPSRTLP